MKKIAFLIFLMTFSSISSTVTAQQDTGSVSYSDLVAEKDSLVKSLTQETLLLSKLLLKQSKHDQKFYTKQLKREMKVRIKYPNAHIMCAFDIKKIGEDKQAFLEGGLKTALDAYHRVPAGEEKDKIKFMLTECSMRYGLNFQLILALITIGPKEERKQCM